MLNSARDRFISAIYSISISPDNYNQTLDQLDELLGDLLTEGEDGSEPNGLEAAPKEVLNAMDPALLSHIENVRQLQSNMPRTPPRRSKLLTLLDATPNPAVVIDRREVIRAKNASVAGETGTIQHLSEFIKDEDVLQALRRFITSDKGPKLLIQPVPDTSDNGSGASVLVRRVEDVWIERYFDDQTASPETLFFVTLFELAFDDEKTDLFRQTFNLTHAEHDIAVHLANGRQAQEIADMRDAQISTIRTQLKSLKKKTNTRDIPAIVRLLSGFSIGLQISDQFTPEAAEQRQVEIAPQLTHRFTLRDGRILTYLEQGNPKGTPVLMLHNMPYGAELMTAAHEAAHRMNLRIITPIRPGYGDSDPLKNSNLDKLLAEVAADTYELLDRLGISKALVIGQSIAIVHAMMFAKIYPNRVSDLVAVSYAPIQSPEFLAKLPRRQRFIQQLAKHLPQLLPVVVQSTITFFDKGYGSSLVKKLLADSPVDVKFLENSPEANDLAISSLHSGLKQGSLAFCQDCLLAPRDYTDLARELSHKMHVLHGDKDGIVEIARSHAFAEAVPGTKVEAVHGAGHFLIYSHWERVLKIVKTLSRKS